MKDILLHPRTTRSSWLWLGAVALLWSGLYLANEGFWAQLVGLTGMASGDHLFGVIHFFLADTTKVLLLLVGMVFLIGLVRTTLKPERVREYLLGKPLAVSLILAALLGAVTPFCSCSSIPLFIGFVAAGVPLAVTLTFLVASPLVNEVAVVMLGQSFGWGITISYVLSGLTLAVLLGALLSRFDLDDQVMDFVRKSPTSRLQESQLRPTMAERIEAAKEEVAEIVGRVWKWVVIGVAIGAVIHGWVPAETLAQIAGPGNPLAVVVVTVLGVPLYSNAAGVIPVAEALWNKGMATGTVLSFMMSTVALSFPEFLLLKQVLKPKLLGIFFGSVTVGIIVTGVGFNLFA